MKLVVGRRGLIASVVAAALVLAGTGVVLSTESVPARSATPDPVQHTIESMMPRTTAIAALSPALTPTTQGTWWREITAFLPISEVMNTQLPPELGVTHLGYTMSQPHVNFKLDLAQMPILYIATSSSSDTLKVVRWLGVSQGNETYVTSVVRGIVVLAPAYSNAAAELPSGPLPASESPIAAAMMKSGNDGLLGIDLARYSALAKISTTQPKAFSTIFTDVTGLEPNTLWVGSASDVSKGWSGSFLSGGYNSHLVNVPQAYKALNSTAVVTPLPGSKGADNIINGEFGAAMIASMFSVYKNGPRGFGVPSLRPKGSSTGGDDLTLYIDPDKLDTALSQSVGSSPTTITLVTVRVTGNVMSVLTTLHTS